MLPALQAQLPPAVSLEVLFDRSITIRNSVQDVKFTLQLALILVVMVIFLFLRNIPATLIPSLALPFSIVGTFAVMRSEERRVGKEWGSRWWRSEERKKGS